ncbi:MAG TPA: ABC transporter ATP-binding protein [Tepidisphaeraceae bacterium]
MGKIAVSPRPYKRLLGYAARYKRGWAVIVVASLAMSMFSLIQPWPMKIIVDQVFSSEPATGAVHRLLGILPSADNRFALLLWMVAAGLLVYLINIALEIVLTFCWLRVGQRMVYDLAGDLFARLQRRSLVFHSTSSVGDSMTRIVGDSWCVNNLIDTLLFSPARAIIMLGAVVWVMARMDPRLTLIAVAVAPFMALSSLMMGKPVRQAARAFREVQSRIQSHVQQALAGLPVVQAFVQEDRETQRFEQYAIEALAAQRRRTWVDNLSNLVTGSIVTIGTAAILWVGSRQVIHGPLTVGGLLLFLAYVVTLQGQFRTLASTYTNLQSTRASIDRVMEVLDVPSEVSDAPGAHPVGRLRGEVRLEDVTFGYIAGSPVLKHVSLDARPGETVAIVGPTGAGKSTLVGLIPRFFDPWQGRVLIDGKNVREMPVKDLRHNVSLVLQEPFLFPMSVAQNIAYGRPDATPEQIITAARDANAHEFITRLPEGYDTIIGERGATLSGGQKQRLSIARALLKDAPILILDEPTSALDAQTEGLLLEALERLMAGRTTFIIAHRLSTIRRADRIVVLVDGAVREQGTHDVLLACGGVYSRLHNAQTAQPHRLAEV